MVSQYRSVTEYTECETKKLTRGSHYERIDLGLDVWCIWVLTDRCDCAF